MEFGAGVLTYHLGGSPPDQSTKPELRTPTRRFRTCWGASQRGTARTPFPFDHPRTHILTPRPSLVYAKHSFACPRPAPMCVEGAWLLRGPLARVVVAVELTTALMRGLELASENPPFASLSCAAGLFRPVPVIYDRIRPTAPSSGTPWSILGLNAPRGSSPRQEQVQRTP